MTTRRFLRLLLAGAPLLAGCGRRSRELNIGVSCRVRPWSYVDMDSGEFTGFDVELARAVCAKLGWRPVFHAIVWAEKERLLATERIDCVWSSFTVTGREKSFALLGPYAANRVVVVTRAGTGIKRNADLFGRNVIVVAGSTGEAALGARGSAAAIGMGLGRLQSAPNLPECKRRLLDGLGDALVVDEDMATVAVRENADRLELVADEPLLNDGLGIGFRLRDTGLRDQIEKVLADLEREGVCAKLSRRFFGHPGRFHLQEAGK